MDNTNGRARFHGGRTRRHFIRDASMATLGLALAPPGLAANSEAGAATGGHPQLSSFYVPMHDGTRIAIDLWLPADAAGRKLGTILQPTRYTRSFRRAGEPIENDSNFATADLINRAGMAYIIADGRGTGASFGSRGGELTATEFDDFAQLIEWIARQSFSNGRVGAMGVSYPGTLTENLAKVAGPALHAVAPLFDYFDVYRDLSMHGGLYSRTFMDRWRDLVGAADRVPELVCGAARKKSQDCEVFAAGLPLPSRVDGPDGAELLRAAMKEHAGNVSFGGLVDEHKLLFRDDSRGEFSWKTMSPDGDHAAIERSGVAYYVQASWLDAGSANGALRRFNALDNSQHVEIGAWSHGGGEVCDPLIDGPVPERSLSERIGPVVEFFAARLGGSGAQARKTRKLRYYVMGSGQWLETPSWPPPQTRMVRHYLDASGDLREAAPKSAALVPIAIKLDHGTGPTGRWGARPVTLAFDRDAQTAGLTAFRTAPFARAAILAGHVRCALRMKSDQSDGSIFAYLDAVLPGGQKRYLTEGALRLIHRGATGDSQSRDFTRRHARPVVPGELFDVEIELLPVAARIEQGWRLQLSFADRDVSWFDRYDNGQAPAMALSTAAVDGSFIELPLLKT